MNAETLCLLAAGVFFLTGLLTGVWKYMHIARSQTATAPVYVDIAHRSSLMYAFSAFLIHGFVPYSPVSPAATVWVVAVPLLFSRRPSAPMCCMASCATPTTSCASRMCSAKARCMAD